MFFSAEFDPLRLTGQIILLQSSFYLVYCTILYLFHLTLQLPLHCALLLSAKSLTVPAQWTGTIILLLTSCSVPFLIQRIIMRTKLCLDFTFTLFFLHIVITILYDGFVVPTSIYFWSVYGSLLVIITIISERLCMQMELSDIPLGFLSAMDPVPSKDAKNTKKKPSAEPKGPGADLTQFTTTTSSVELISTAQLSSRSHSPVPVPTLTTSASVRLDVESHGAHNSAASRTLTSSPMKHQGYLMGNHSGGGSESDDDNDVSGESRPLNPHQQRRG